MKELLKSYKLWLIVSVTILITLIAVIISFAGNYHELEGLRDKSYEDTKQKAMIASLSEENSNLKKDNKAADESSMIDEIIKTYVANYFNLSGNESENSKAMKLKPYVTEELFGKMYDPDEKEESFSSAAVIVQTGTITDTTVQISGTNQARALADLNITYYYPDGTKDYQTITLKMEFLYGTEWRLSGVSSSNSEYMKIWS